MSAGQLEAYVENESGLGCWVQLPTSKEAFLEAVAAIGVTDPVKDRILVTDVEPEWEVLSPHLNEPFDLGELNLLSSKLEGLDEERFNTFAACLQAGRSNSIPEMINLLENLDSFDLQPAFTPEQYGAFHINLARDEYADMMNRLEQSTDPEEQAFFAYVAEIESHIDLASYGKMQAENENGTFTDYGYLSESAALQEVYRGPQDIPAELQVSPFQEIQPLLKLENTDLTEALTKLHTVTGHTADLEHNLEVLHRRRSAEFLLLLTDDKAILSEAMHIYRQGTTVHDAFVNSTEANMFSIYVSDFQTNFIGDIREVGASARRTDILDHSMVPLSVEAEEKDGNLVTFTPEEWKTLGPEERGFFQSWTRQFADGDYSKMFRHTEQRSYLDGQNSHAIPAEKFFAKLEQEFPAKAERTLEPRPRSVLEQLAAARTERTSEQPKPQQSKHRTEPER